MLGHCSPCPATPAFLSSTSLILLNCQKASPSWAAAVLKEAASCSLRTPEFVCHDPCRGAAYAVKSEWVRGLGPVPAIWVNGYSLFKHTQSHHHKTKGTVLKFPCPRLACFTLQDFQWFHMSWICPLFKILKILNIKIVMVIIFLVSIIILHHQNYGWLHQH